MADIKSSKFHIAMFPWLAIGQMTPFLHLSNRLAQKGFRITFLLPEKAIELLRDLNLYPNLITFHPLTIPQVDGLPQGTEIASDIPIDMWNLLCVALDRTRDQVDQVIHTTKPELVIYDFGYWVPEITRPLGIKTLMYNVISAVAIAMGLGLNPSSMFRGPEIKSWSMFLSQPFGEGLTLQERITKALKECDAIAIRTCQELEGKSCDYIGSQLDNKKVLLTGPVLPDPATSTSLDDKSTKWLDKFEPGSVIFCTFGSQVVLEKNQFQEILLGFEMTELPFLVSLRPPKCTSTVDEALPEGFAERVKDRGVVEGEWVPQVAILNHPSIGCFVSHCGFGSFWESLMSKSQIVLVPDLPDEILNTRLLSEELKVAIEIKKDETKWVTKEKLSNSIMFAMDKNDKEACFLRSNHLKWRKILTSPGFMNDYVDKFLNGIQELVG